MTEDPRKQYEEAANTYRDNNFVEGSGLHTYSPMIFTRGCEYAHSKIEEAEREAWNRAIDEAAKLIWALRNEPHVSVAEVNDEIQKLRKMQII